MWWKIKKAAKISENNNDQSKIKIKNTCETTLKGRLFTDFYMVRNEDGTSQASSNSTDDIDDADS